MAGGLGEYLGIDANVIRIGFVLVSVMFLAVFGGLVLYAIAWAIMPEQRPSEPGEGAPAYPGAPPYQDGRRSDRTARSWALVLGAAAVALIWSFGLARWWHSGAAVVWLVFAAIALWFFTRCRRTGGCGPARRQDQATTSQQSAPQGAPPTTGPPPGAEAAPAGLTPEEAADWAAARAAAAGWAKEQLDAAGVPPSAVRPVAPGPPQGASGGRRRTGYPRLWTVVAAAFAAITLVVVAGVIAITLASGASFNGGVGNKTVKPPNLASVKSHYRLGVGRLEVDLSRVHFPPRGRNVDVNVGVGDLQLVLPRNTVVRLDASSGIAGDVHLPGGSAAGHVTETDLSVPARLAAGRSSQAGHLTVDAHVGAGMINVSWGR